MNNQLLSSVKNVTPNFAMNDESSGKNKNDKSSLNNNDIKNQVQSINF